MRMKNNPKTLLISADDERTIVKENTADSVKVVEYALERKIANDVYYAEHVSFAFDVKIFAKTIISVLKRENIYVSAEGNSEVKK